MSGEAPKNTLDNLFMEESEEVRIQVFPQKGDGPPVFFIFKPMDTATLRKYRTIFNGPPGSRRGKPDEAIRFVFKEKYVRVDDLDYTIEGYADEVEFWLKNPRAGLLIDSVMNAYLSRSLPDADELKK